jgi:hypothetical protein
MFHLIGVGAGSGAGTALDTYLDSFATGDGTNFI